MLLQLNDIVHKLIWGPATLLFFCGCGIYISVRLNFFQLTQLPLWLKNTLGTLFTKNDSAKKSGVHTISAFQAFTCALAGTLGTGNIVGVATAIAAGGPGAVFWMWVSAFFGMMTAYAENVLGILYRKKDSDSKYKGGPMYYLRDGLKSKFAATSFAVFAILASFGMGNMTQSNSIALALNDTFGIPVIATGIITCAALAAIALGGIKRIGRATAILIPAMATLYILGCVAIIIMFRHNILSAFAAIFNGAFNLRSAAGGALGYTVLSAMRFGIARGVFSNEAGLGSSVLIHSSSNVKEPVEQGMWSICEVFVDTIVMCTLTALCILTTGVFDGTLNGAVLVANAFFAGFGPMGSVFLSVAVTLFAFSTLLSWSYNGQLATQYLFGTRACTIYRAVFIALVPIGCITQLDIVWSISDTCNGFMALPNLFGVLFLSGQVFKETRRYLQRRKNKHHKNCNILYIIQN